MVVGINLSGTETNERRNWVKSNLNMVNENGWVLWTECPPEINIEIECCLKYDNVTWLVTPKAETIGWNVEGVYWRPIL